MMLYWFIKLREIDWHLVGIKIYEFIICLKQISVIPLKNSSFYTTSLEVKWVFLKSHSAGEREIDSLVDRMVDTLHPHT